MNVSVDSSFRYNVLYVDDEDHNLAVFEAAFEDHYAIYTADSARKAMEILREEDIHLIVTDQRMPDITGVQLLEVVLEEYPDVIRMILTGFTDIDAILRAINAGRVYQYATKPWDEQQLKLILDRALESWSLKRRNDALLEELQLRSSREAELRRAFQQYVPASVAEELLDEDKDLRFLGETRIVALLLVDLQGFHRLTDRLDARKIVASLNHFFQIATQTIRSHKGNVNKFLGDGILALFGAPVASLDSTGNAVQAALDLQELFQTSLHSELNEILGTGGENLNLGAIVHVGEALAGNLGPDGRTEYSVIGESLEIALRLDRSSTRDQGRIWISEEVRRTTQSLVRTESASNLGADEVRFHPVSGRAT